MRKEDQISSLQRGRGSRVDVPHLVFSRIKEIYIN